VILMANERSPDRTTGQEMIEDEFLKWTFKCGSRAALSRIYRKYLNYLLTLAMALLNDADSAEDVVNDVFVTFAKNVKYFKLHGSLKSYLATCVINRARDQIRTNQRRPTRLDEDKLDLIIASDAHQPQQQIRCSEESRQLNQAIAQLPYEQREVIILHLKGDVKFNQIAKLQGVSVNTVRGRYRYGLDKLRSILNGEVKK